MAEQLGISSDDAVIFSINSDPPDDTEDPWNATSKHNDPRLQRSPSRALKSGTFPDGTLFNLTPGARKIP
jgi:hypothetical protein